MNPTSISESDETRNTPETVLHTESEISALMEKAVSEQKFTAWSCANSDSHLSIFYADECAPYHPFLGESQGDFLPQFDLASLTKPLFLNLGLRLQLNLSAEPFCREPLTNLLSIRTHSGELLRESLRDSKLTLNDFLNHTTGAKPWSWFGRGLWHTKLTSKNGLSDFADLHWENLGDGELKERVELCLTKRCLGTLAKTSQPTQYSDLNYFLLARIIENLTAFHFTNWNDFLTQINQKCGTTFTHASLLKRHNTQTVPYFPYVINDHDDAFLSSDTESFGLVHDTNANILSGLKQKEQSVSGHAGLFGSLADVKLASGVLAQSQSEYLVKFPNQPSGRFVYGLDTPSQANSLAGLKHWPLDPDESFYGHLGYTGCSFWLRFKQGLESNVLLTNRTAKRTLFGAAQVGRMAVCGKWDDKSLSYYYAKPQKRFLPISRTDAYEILSSGHSNSKKFWDRNHLHQPADIADIRKFFGQKCWS